MQTDRRPVRDLRSLQTLNDASAQTLKSIQLLVLSLARSRSLHAHEYPVATSPQIDNHQGGAGLIIFDAASNERSARGALRWMLGVRIILMHMQFALHGIEHPILAETGSEIVCLLGGDRKSSEHRQTDAIDPMKTTGRRTSKDGW